MNLIINAIIALGAVGLFFGVILSIASKAFAVKVDPKETLVRAAVPGANCGACGFPGCDGFSKAVVAGVAPVNGCPVGGAETAAKIAEVMGVAAGDADKQVARVACNGTSASAGDKYEYYGVETCKAAAAVQKGPKACEFGCMGFGDCVTACAFDALHIVDGIAKVDPDKCVGCKACVATCPKSIIDMVPASQKVFVDCKNQDKGKAVKDVCQVGCIACTLCVKACPFDAIHMVDGVAKIDYAECKNCKICAKKCPTGAIFPQLKLKEMAEKKAAAAAAKKEAEQKDETQNS